MNITSSHADMMEIVLRQMGASSVQSVSGKLFFVKFTLQHNHEVSYSYNINAKSQYFLQRIAPYPLPEGVFANEDSVIAFIEKDLMKFKNATNSNNFNQFVSVTNKINILEHSLESLFLNYNVNTSDLDYLNETILKLTMDIQKFKEASMHIDIDSKANKTL